MQHDRTFMRHVPVQQCLDALRMGSSVNMISMLTSSTANHAERVCARLASTGFKLCDRDLQQLSTPKHVCGLRLLPMLQWLDSTHLAQVRCWRLMLSPPQLAAVHTAHAHLNNQLQPARRPAVSEQIVSYFCRWLFTRTLYLLVGGSNKAGLLKTS